MLPDTVKFTVIVVALAGLVYGAAVLLSTYPPESTPITRPLPNDKLRQK
jgi:hypothetical protein